MKFSPEFEFFDEAVSGTKLRRDGLDALLAAAREHRFNLLFFHSLSRLARECVISLPILKELVYVHKVRVISVTEGLDSNRPGWTLGAVFSSLQSEKFIEELSANVLRGQEGVVLKRLCVGDYCFGFTSVVATDIQRSGKNAKPYKRYAVNPETADWVARIFHWFVVDRRPIRWIVEELNRLGAPKDHRSTTKVWRHGTVARVLGNEKYIGKWAWGQRKNVRIPGSGKIIREDRSDKDIELWSRHFPELQIVPEAQFREAQRLLDENAERVNHRKPDGKFLGSAPGGSGGRRPHLLHRLIRCRECHAVFQVAGVGGKYLQCPNFRAGTCGCRTQLERRRAERLIIGELSRRILRNDVWIKAIYDDTISAWRQAASRLPSEFELAEKAYAEVERKIAKLVDVIESSDDSAALRARLAEREADKRELAAKLSKLRRDKDAISPEPTTEWIEGELHCLDELLQSDTPTANEALKKLVGAVEVEQIIPTGKVRGFLRGTFHIPSDRIIRSIYPDSPWAACSEDGEPPFAETITIDFLQPDGSAQAAETAYTLFASGMLEKDIALQLNCARSTVTRLLHKAFAVHGEAKPDGRGRRHLVQPPNDNAIYRKIADESVRLILEGVSTRKIAEQFETTDTTVAKAIAVWHQERGLEIPTADVLRERRNAQIHDLFFIEKRTVEQIAEELDVCGNTVRKVLKSPSEVDRPNELGPSLVSDIQIPSAADDCLPQNGEEPGPGSHLADRIA